MKKYIEITATVTQTFSYYAELPAEKTLAEVETALSERGLNWARFEKETENNVSFEVARSHAQSKPIVYPWDYIVDYKW